MQFFNAYSHWRNTSMTQNSRFNISSFTLHVLAMGLMLRNHGRLLWNWSFNCFDILFFPKTNLENLINPIYTPVTHFTRFISLFWFYCDIDCWNNSPECSCVNINKGHQMEWRYLYGESLILETIFLYNQRQKVSPGLISGVLIDGILYKFLIILLMIDFFIIFVYSLINTHELVDFSVRPASTLTNE